jgi:hypothetical protein
MRSVPCDGEKMDSSLETTFEQAAVGMAQVSPDGRWLRVNRKLCAILGRTPAELLGRSLLDLAHPDDLADCLEAARRMLAGEIEAFSGERRYLREDGTPSWVNLNVALAREGPDSPAHFILVLEDIQTRKDAEAAIGDRELFLAHAPAALNSIQDAVFISDAEGRFIEFNDAFATFHKFRSKAECAKTFAEYPGFLDVFLPGGEPAPVSQWAVPRALRGETAASAEYGLRRKDTGERWVGSYSFGPIRDPGGAIIGSVVVGRDITEAKHMAEELQFLNTRLEHRVTERTAELQAANRELDSFAYAVSHDLRAPLRAMGGFSRALTEDFGDLLPPEGKSFLTQIELGSRRMGDLVDGILTLSRCTRGELKRDLVDVSALSAMLIAELTLAEPGRRVVTEIEPGLQVCGDDRMIEAVMRNLLGNAWKYTSRSPEARIRVRAEETGGQRWICVADTGAGFDMAYASHLFQPFQRLHRQDEFPGMGIGLATVQRIVERHGGQIQAQSEPSAGATFKFSLPPMFQE